MTDQTSRASTCRAWLGIEPWPRIGRWNSWPSGQSRTFCVIRLGGFGKSAVTWPSPAPFGPWQVMQTFS